MNFKNYQFSITPLLISAADNQADWAQYKYSKSSVYQLFLLGG